MPIRLDEKRKSEIVNPSKSGANYKDQSKGKNRFDRRVKSRVANSVREFNEIDMNKLFKDNILDVNIKVNGETDDYIVSVSFVGVLDNIHDELKRSNKEEVDYRIIQRALIRTINTDDQVMVGCNCSDWVYRFGYYANKEDYLNNKGQWSSIMLNDAPTATNPNNDKGKACKHVLLVLNNLNWLIKVTSVIFNYINYMKKHYERLYADVIYPALYEKKYEEPVQLDLDIDNKGDQLDTDTDTIDTSNKYARSKNQFQKGNQEGNRFISNSDEKEINFDDILSYDN